VSFPPRSPIRRGGALGWTIRQRCQALFERRDFNEVMLEISKRLGILHKFYKG